MPARAERKCCMIKEFAASGAVARYFEILGHLPRALADEIREISRSVGSFTERLSEIRVRADGLSTLTVGGVGYPLFYRVSRAEMSELLYSLTDGAAYAHKDTMSRGFISISGVRVGVSGAARYDGDEVGIGEISALVFRLGGASCDFAGELYGEWFALGMPNMLVASPPMGGKTTALRALAKYIGSGRGALRVAVVDERCEFDRSEYRDVTVDVLSGYRRSQGIEQAYRTMAAEVIIVDEIATASESEALLASHGAGVRLIASVHASSFSEVRERACLSPLLEVGVFGVCAVIRHEGLRYTYELGSMTQ